MRETHFFGIREKVRESAEVGEIGKRDALAKSYVTFAPSILSQEILPANNNRLRAGERNPALSPWNYFLSIVFGA